mgnify:CR=1 FL=1
MKDITMGIMDVLLKNPIDPITHLANLLEAKGRENEVNGERIAKQKFEELLTHVDEMSARIAAEKGENSTMATGITGYSSFSKR